MREPVKKHSAAGKGDKERKGFDRKAFAEGMDRIDWSASSCKHDFKPIYPHRSLPVRCRKCGKSSPSI